MSLSSPPDSRYRPTNLASIREREGDVAAWRELDRAVQYITIRLNAIDQEVNATATEADSGAITQGGNITDIDTRLAAIETLVFGSKSVTGTGTVSTGLTSITGAWLTIQGSSAVTYTPTWTASGGTLTIYCWKPTAAGNTAPIAETVAKTVYYLVRGS